MKERGCKICKARFAPGVWNQLTCSEKCARVNRNRIWAMAQRKKYALDAEWRARRQKRGYARFKKRVKTIVSFAERVRARKRAWKKRQKSA